MYYYLSFLKKPQFTYILNDLSFKKEKLKILNDCTIIIDYGNKIEELFVRANDIFKYNTNLIHTNKNSHDIYVNAYKSKGLYNTIKFTCITDSLQITQFIEEKNVNTVYGEDEKWDGIF